MVSSQDREEVALKYQHVGKEMRDCYGGELIMQVDPPTHTLTSVVQLYTAIVANNCIASLIASGL